MEFRKKLKIRLILAIAYIVIGVALIVCFNLQSLQNEFYSTFGVVLLVVGLVKMRQYFRITKTEDSLKKQEIFENDERNVSIVNKAKSAAFNVYVILVAVAVIVLYIMNYIVFAKILSYSICLLIVVYWIAYAIIRKKF